MYLSTVTTALGKTRTVLSCGIVPGGFQSVCTTKIELHFLIAGHQIRCRQMFWVSQAGIQTPRDVIA